MPAAAVVRNICRAAEASGAGGAGAAAAAEAIGGGGGGGGDGRGFGRGGGGAGGERGGLASRGGGRPAADRRIDIEEAARVGRLGQGARPFGGHGRRGDDDG